MAKNPRFERKQAIREVRKKYIIATEGERTEKIYFERFCDTNSQKNIFIKILATKDGSSSPNNVLDRLIQFANDKAFDKERDEGWLVIDYDNWGDAKLAQIADACTKKGFKLAVSNPCFELWLNLHQKNPKTPSSCEENQKELAKLLGSYKKNSFDVDALMRNLDLAINTASKLDTKPKESFPKTVGSRVYLLVEKLIEE